MSFATVEKIANAVLYEGYMLYPYRASAIKNRQRWNFGTLYPVSYAEIQLPAEQSRMITECLVNGESAATLDVRVRFLQLARSCSNAALSQSLEWQGERQGEWEEGFEKSADFFTLSLSDLATRPHIFDVQFQERDTTAAAENHAASFRQRSLTGTLLVHAEVLQPELYKVRFVLENKTDIKDVAQCSRNDVMLQSFVSAHLLLAVHGGQFVSLLEPPEAFRQACSGCSNIGAFPVLVSDAERQIVAGTGKMMLSSPIILYDYPQVAPESGGDFFDATEMDEMLALRVMTLTDEEKQEMRDGDSRARAILERTESLRPEHLMKVHGAVRGLRKIQEWAGDVEGDVEEVRSGLAAEDENQ